MYMYIIQLTGNIVGYGLSLISLHKLFPFLLTSACADLKGNFFISIIDIIILSIFIVVYVKEPPINHEEVPQALTLWETFKNLLKEIKKRYMAANGSLSLGWAAWKPFILSQTGWMGREILEAIQVRRHTSTGFKSHFILSWYTLQSLLGHPC